MMMRFGGSRRLRLLRGARGQVLAIAALALPVMLGMGALSVDVGYMYVARTAMQTAADAGTRAGAAILAAGGTQAAANTEALNFANQNLGRLSYLTGATPAVSFPTATSIQVNITHSLPLFFAPVIGFNTAGVNATAAASIAAASSIPSGLVPLAIYCNNPSGCAGVLAVGQTWSMRRYCGNFFADGASGNSCGNAIASGENFLAGITVDNSNSNAAFREAVYSGVSTQIAYGDSARALPGNRNGWRSGMTDRLAEGRDVMTLAVIRELAPVTQTYNVQIVDFVQVRVSNFTESGNTDTTTFEIIRSAVSTNSFAAAGEGYGIDSVVGVRLTQ
ncbi:MAG: Tad domain-containing protein [Nitrospinota bacterium]